MMYDLEFTETANRILKKLGKKKPKQLRIAKKKIQQILDDPYRFKPLKHPLSHLRRVHVDKSFVLLYEIKKDNKTVVIWDYDHHDKIYKK